jgi:hypothetical protein
MKDRKGIPRARPKMAGANTGEKLAPAKFPLSLVGPGARSQRYPVRARLPDAPEPPCVGLKHEGYPGNGR